MRVPSTSLSLLDGIRRAETDSWQRFVEVYSPVIYARCRKNCSDADSADIVQEVFLKVNGAIGKFKPDGRPKAFSRWLSTIIGHEVINHFNRQKKTPPGIGGSDAAMMFKNLEAAVIDAYSVTGESDATLLVRTLLKLFENEVSRQTLLAFQMTAIEGMTSAEVARELGMTPAAVRKSSQRIRDKINDELDGMF